MRPEEVISVDQCRLARPFSRSLPLSWGKLRNAFTSVQGPFGAGGTQSGSLFPAFFDSESVTLRSWVCFSVLYPSSPEQGATVPTCPSLLTSHVPQPLPFILPDARCCSLRSHQETPVNAMLPGPQVPKSSPAALTVSVKGTLSDLRRKSVKHYALLLL